jgi:hypothetical protein
MIRSLYSSIIVLNYYILTLFILLSLVNKVLNNINNLLRNYKEAEF